MYEQSARAQSETLLHFSKGDKKRKRIANYYSAPEVITLPLLHKVLLMNINDAINKVG